MSDQQDGAMAAQSSSPERPTSDQKRSRGRPRKYHTDAEREEAKKRYRENHKTKAAGGTAVASSGQGSPSPKQNDVDELWEAIHVLQTEVVDLKRQLQQQKDLAPASKRKKM